MPQNQPAAIASFLASFSLLTTLQNLRNKLSSQAEEPWCLENVFAAVLNCVLPALLIPAVLNCVVPALLIPPA